MTPRVGCMSPVMSLNSVVFPVPFRPMIPQRSRARDRERDVREQLRRAELHRDVGEGQLGHAVLTQPLHSVSASPTLSRFCCRTSGIFSISGSSANSSSQRSSDMRALRNPRSTISLRAVIDQRGHAELLREAAKLAERCGALREIDEMRFHSPLGEEAQRLARVRILFYTENLNVHTEINARDAAFPSVCD